MTLVKVTRPKLDASALSRYFVEFVNDMDKKGFKIDSDSCVKSFYNKLCCEEAPKHIHISVVVNMPTIDLLEICNRYNLCQTSVSSNDYVRTAVVTGSLDAWTSVSQDDEYLDFAKLVKEKVLW